MPLHVHEYVMMMLMHMNQHVYVLLHTYQNVYVDMKVSIPVSKPHTCVIEYVCD